MCKSHVFYKNMIRTNSPLLVLLTFSTTFLFASESDADFDKVGSYFNALEKNEFVDSMTHLQMKDVLNNTGIK